MSILLFALSAANSVLPDVLLVIANPVYAAPGAVTPISAEFGLNVDQPLIVPSKVANRNTDVQLSILNSVEPLYTMPVGLPGPVPLAGGITTFKLWMFPLPS